jgi:hypothetical protein
MSDPVPIQLKLLTLIPVAVFLWIGIDAIVRRRFTFPSRRSVQPPQVMEGSAAVIAGGVIAGVGLGFGYLMFFYL